MSALSVEKNLTSFRTQSFRPSSSCSHTKLTFPISASTSNYEQIFESTHNSKQSYLNQTLYRGLDLRDPIEKSERRM